MPNKQRKCKEKTDNLDLKNTTKKLKNYYVQVIPTQLAKREPQRAPLLQRAEAQERRR